MHKRASGRGDRFPHPSPKRPHAPEEASRMRERVPRNPKQNARGRMRSAPFPKPRGFPGPG